MTHSVAKKQDIDTMIPLDELPLHAYLRGHNLFVTYSHEVAKIKEYVEENLPRYHVKCIRRKHGFKVTLWSFDRESKANNSGIHFKNRLKYLEHELNDL